VGSNSTGQLGLKNVGKVFWNSRTPELYEEIVRRQEANLIKKQAVSEGLRPLRDDGALKIVRGVTTVEEVLRVTQDDMV